MEEHIMQQTTSEQKPQWISVSEIQKEYLPISKKAIRRMLKQNLDIARTGGKKILVERTQLEAFLHYEI